MAQEKKKEIGGKFVKTKKIVVNDNRKKERQ